MAIAVKKREKVDIKISFPVQLYWIFLLWSNILSGIEDERRAAKCYELINSWGNPFEKSELSERLSGTTCVSMETATNLMRAENVRKTQLEKFIAGRVELNNVSFYAPIPEK